MDLSPRMPELIALGQVLSPDIAPAGGSAIVVGLAAAGCGASPGRVTGGASPRPAFAA